MGKVITSEKKELIKLRSKTRNQRSFKHYIMMSAGCILLSIGIYFFKIPNGFVTGGVSGIGTVLAKIIPISAGLLIWGLNIILMVLGFIFLGKKTAINTVYCSMLYSFITYLLETFVPIQGPLTNQPLLELIYAMLLTSIGSAMIFNVDASSGGTDIVALMLKKFSALDVGKALLAVDFVVAASSFVVYDIKAGLFSLLGLFAKAFLVDSVIESLNACKYFMVITSKPEEISEYIIKTLRHGVTTSTVIGEYTKDEKTMVHTVCKRIEAVKLRSAIKEIDPGSFVIITTSSEIIGRGFRSV